MTETLNLPALGIDEEFPEVVYLLSHPSTKRYGCYCHQGVHGLACFSSEVAAVRFSEWIELSGMEVIDLPFDDAREVAKERPLPVVALMLLDKLEDPKIHYVR